MADDDTCACGKQIEQTTFSHFMACGEPSDDALGEDWYAVLGERIALRMLGADPATFPQCPEQPQEGLSE